MKASYKQLKSPALFTLAAITCLPFVTSTYVSALSPGMQEFYDKSNAPFFRPDADPGSDSCSAGGSVTLRGDSNAEQIWNFFIDNGLSPNQAAGVMGNLAQESGYKPDMVESNGIGYGIAQWSFGRRTQLENAAKKANVKPSDMGFQLKFLLEEATSRPAKGGGGTEWEVLKTKKSIEDALVFWHDSFERSADTASEVIKVRGGYAKDAYASFASGSDSTGETGSSTSCTDTSLDGSQSSIQKLVKEYAWPTYTRGYTKQKPAYTEAVAVAKSQGRFLGGNNQNGNDCGGFVTTIVYDSGIDKNYNPKKGNTSVQKQYLDSNWKKLGSGSQINVADLKPGDVAMYPGHTYIYIGDVDGFEQKWASASVDGPRSPMAGRENPTAGNTNWYRYGGGASKGASPQ